MEKLLIPQDKANHFLYGFLIYFIATFFFSPIYSFAIIFFIALVKEIVVDLIYDKGNPEVKDFIFSIIPGLLLMIKFYL